MKKNKLIVTTSSNKYPIIIGKNIISKISKIMRDNSIINKKYLIVVDKNIPKIMLRKITNSLKKKDVYTHVFIATEKNKNQKNVNIILNILFKRNFSRDDCLISVGGGITGDVCGFAASLYKRGMKFINVPTTLLSQVDSSIGGKTGVNNEYGKNMIGSFYQPHMVLSDSEFLYSLKQREIICGYGEILKHSLIANKNFFNYLDKNLLNILDLKSPYIEKTIYQSCKIKKKIIEKDEKEKDLRKVLNLGHTFAHAFEATLGFSNKLNHGEAVILGIYSAIKFCQKKSLINMAESREILNHLKKLYLKDKINKFFKIKNLNTILSFMTKDKKNNSDKINLILLKNIGKPILNQKFSKTSLKEFFKKQLFY